jgi:hypothetical protein
VDALPLTHFGLEPQSRPPRWVTGNFFVDDEVLRAHGVTDLSRYNPSGVADIDVTPDLFVTSLRELARKE